MTADRRLSQTTKWRSSLFDNEGRELDIAFNNELGQGPNPAPIISNLDGSGFAEIVVEAVITVGQNDAGNCSSSIDLKAERQWDAIPVKARSHASPISSAGRPQVIGGTAVYSWPEPPPGATQRSDCANRGGQVQPTNERERAYCDGELVLNGAAQTSMGVKPLAMGIVLLPTCSAVTRLWHRVQIIHSTVHRNALLFTRAVSRSLTARRDYF